MTVVSVAYIQGERSIKGKDFRTVLYKQKLLKKKGIFADKIFSFKKFILIKSLYAVLKSEREKFYFQEVYLSLFYNFLYSLPKENRTQKMRIYLDKRLRMI